MIPLIQQIKSDQIAARKARKNDEAKLLTTLLGEAEMVGKNDGNRETTDEEVIAVVKKFIKNNNESIAVLDVNSNASLTLQEENSFLALYLPRQLSEENIKEFVDGELAKLETVNMSSMGSIMKALNATYPGQVDGKVASQLIRQTIQEKQ